MTHKCISKITIIGSDNGLSPGRRQAIIWTIAWILLIGPLETNYSEILIKIDKFSFKKSISKYRLGWRPFCLGLNVLIGCNICRKTSNIRRTLISNNIVDHSDVVGASPVGAAAPTASSFSAWHLASRDSAKKAARQYENLLSVGILCVLYYWRYVSRPRPGADTPVRMDIVACETAVTNLSGTSNISSEHKTAIKWHRISCNSSWNQVDN